MRNKTLTINQMVEEIKRIENKFYTSDDKNTFREYKALFREFLAESKYDREYIATNAKKDEIENMLSCVRLASIETVGEVL